MEAFLNAPSGHISLGTSTTRIGSDPNNELILDDPLIAPVHAEITVDGQGYQLTDLTSPHGTFINQQSLVPGTPRQLQNGDMILIGNTSLVYETSIASASTVSATIAEAEIPAQATEIAASDQPTDPRMPIPSTPQAIPAQSYTPIAAVNYPATPIFPQPGAATDPLPQPEYPTNPYIYNQGGYALLPGQIQPFTSGQLAPAPTEKKRGRLALWIILISIGLLLLGGSNTITYALTRPQVSASTTPHAPTLPAPDGALKTYCQGIMTGNSEEIYDLLSAQAKIHTSLDDLQKTFEMLKLLNSSSMSEQYTNCTFNNIRKSGPLAVGTVMLTASLTFQVKDQKQTLTETIPELVSLVWEQNQWKIDYSRFSQPQPVMDQSMQGTSPFVP